MKGSLSIVVIVGEGMLGGSVKKESDLKRLTQKDRTAYII